MKAILQYGDIRFPIQCNDYDSLLSAAEKALSSSGGQHITSSSIIHLCCSLDAFRMAGAEECALLTAAAEEDAVRPLSDDEFSDDYNKEKYDRYNTNGGAATTTTTTTTTRWYRCDMVSEDCYAAAEKRVQQLTAGAFRRRERLAALGLMDKHGRLLCAPEDRANYGTVEHNNSVQRVPLPIFVLEVTVCEATAHDDEAEGEAAAYPTDVSNNNSNNHYATTPPSNGHPHHANNNGGEQQQQQHQEQQNGGPQRRPHTAGATYSIGQPIMSYNDHVVVSDLLEAPDDMRASRKYVMKDSNNNEYHHVLLSERDGKKNAYPEFPALPLNLNAPYDRPGMPRNQGKKESVDGQDPASYMTYVYTVDQRYRDQMNSGKRLVTDGAAPTNNNDNNNMQSECREHADREREEAYRNEAEAQQQQQRDGDNVSPHNRYDDCPASPHQQYPEEEEYGYDCGSKGADAYDMNDCTGDANGYASPLKHHEDYYYNGNCQYVNCTTAERDGGAVGDAEASRPSGLVVEEGDSDDQHHHQTDNNNVEPNNNKNNNNNNNNNHVRLPDIRPVSAAPRFFRNIQPRPTPGNRRYFEGIVRDQKKHDASYY